MPNSILSKPLSRLDIIKASSLSLLATSMGCHPKSTPGNQTKSMPVKNMPENPNVSPLAQDYVIVERTPNIESHYIHDPGMTRLTNGHLFVATCARTRLRDKHNDFTFLSLSVDGGNQWESLGTIPFPDATAIVHGSSLYIMGQYRQGKDWLIMRSDDEGRTWTDPVTLFKGKYWNCQSSMVLRNGHLYWAMNEMTHGWYTHVAVACDLSRGLLSPSSWRMSNTVEPPFPDLCSPMPRGKNWKGQCRPGGLVCLEPNVVQVGDRLMAISRGVISSYNTANMGVIFDITDKEGQLRLEFTQFYPLPGGQCKFFIIHDKVSKLFFMLSNLVTDSQDSLNMKKKPVYGGTGNERRMLFLFYSRDALNWFPAGCVAKMPEMDQSFMYPSAVIDGNDLALISRTSKNGKNQHDADLCTFHRIRDFRKLAMNLL
jgi:hypothetical protein